MNKKQFIVLMGKRRDVLPAGFTALEYLESSGTQYIHFGTYNPNSLKVRASFILPDNNAALSGAMGIFGGQTSPYTEANYNWGTTILQRRGSGVPAIMFNKTGWTPDSVVFGGLNNVSINAKKLSWNGSIYTIEEDFVNSQLGAVLFAAYDRDMPSMFSSALKIVRFAWSDENSNFDLIPALRDSDGVPGMFDRVSKQFFVNNGSGTFGYRIKGAPATFALRDPHRVAPSGVYARLIPENELELIADTEEVTGEGWEWFSNTAEAYEHFNIVPAGANEL